jgi:N-acetylmuramoyl-L-alanine amidase
MHEDDLTVAIGLQAQSQLSASGYRVVMTKTDTNNCPTFLERANKANNEKTNVFVSVHINAPSRVPFVGLGSSGLYNSAKSSSKTLADLVAAQVASNLGVSNRGSFVRDGLAVLKPTTTRMSAIIIEVARLSGSDETILHNAGSTARAASGIKSGIDAFINQ